MLIRFTLIALMSAALPALGGQRQVPAPVVLYTNFVQAASGAAVTAIQEEMEAIMGPLGMHFEWRSLSSARGTEVAAELAVVTFKGRCDTAGLVPQRAEPGPLGWTHVSDGVILPFTDIDCERIRLFLQRDLLYLRAEDRDEAFGRAIGRVLAHELYHIFTQTARHGAEGVAKPAYTVRELLSDEFLFEEHEALRLRSAAGRIVTAPDKPVGTP
jgi:hypothetical protein